MKLRTYLPNDARIIVNWIKDEYALRLWSADRYRNFPVCADDINSYYNKYSENTYFFTALDELDNVIGHFTIRYPNIDDKKPLDLVL